MTHHHDDLRAWTIADDGSWIIPDEGLNDDHAPEQWGIVPADYIPGVAITTADPPNRYRPNGVHFDVPDHLVDRVSAYYIGASIINPNRPIIITEA